MRAIEVYDRVIKIVSPKKAKLAEAETELARQMDKLNEKRTQLQQVTDKLQVCGHEFNGKIANFSLPTCICTVEKLNAAKSCTLGSFYNIYTVSN